MFSPRWLARALNAAPLLMISLVAAGSVQGLRAQEAPNTNAGPTTSPARPETDAAAPVERVSPPQNSLSQPVPPGYDKTIFQKPVPAGEMTFLTQFDGATSGDLYRDKQFRKLIKNGIPDVTFHYGSDKSMSESIDEVLSGSKIPVLIRQGRYVVVAGQNGPYLAGRGFLWIDMQDGIILGAFFFHPTNGEPTPSVTVFSRQVKEDYIAMSELPPAFAEDLAQWSAASSVPGITTRYFIGGVKKKLLLEHDEDYCSPADGSVAASGNDCQQMIAEAADIDVTAAYFLDQVHYATNATAWMLGPDQTAWIHVRERTCGIGPDPLGCHIRMARERTVVILGGRPRRRR